MTLSKLKRLHHNRRLEAQVADDAFLLTSILRQHAPITRERIREISGLPVTRFNRAMAKINGTYWIIEGKPRLYELPTNTAVL